MSTKITLSHDTEVHLYQEVADESTLYLKVEKPGVSLKIELDVSHALAIAKAFDWSRATEMAAVSDEEIDLHVREHVSARLNAKGISALAGMLVYGNAEDPEREQIERGLAFYREQRDRIKAALSRVQNPSPFSFGMEEFIKRPSDRP